MGTIPLRNYWEEETYDAGVFEKVEAEVVKQLKRPPSLGKVVKEEETYDAGVFERVEADVMKLLC